MSRKLRVQYTYMSQHNKQKNVRPFYDALFDLIGLMNQPQRDIVLLQEADVSLDRALFQLLVAIDRHNAVGIVELAGLVGRDHSTVSRQIASLKRQGLVIQQSSRDGREHKVIVTPEGLNIVHALDAARERLLQPVLSQWNEQDWQMLVSLLRRFADDALALQLREHNAEPSPKDDQGEN
jgi:DNA-binding MarR family transcriptional regulator